jgi:hypothetical protein
MGARNLSSQGSVPCALVLKVVQRGEVGADDAAARLISRRHNSTGGDASEMPKESKFGSRWSSEERATPPVITQSGAHPKGMAAIRQRTFVCPALSTPIAPWLRRSCFPMGHHSVTLSSMSYLPAPIETAAVSLSPELLALTERLAENAHDLWAAQRIADGWTFGPKRDDAAKKHPCLLPYAELPDSEKVYDRQTALGTLKAITALGYTIASGASR